MTLENTLLQKLADWRPKSRDTLLATAPTSAWTASITADRCESLGCQLWEVAVRRPAGGQPLDLKAWAERLEQATLLEPFQLIEVDDTRHLAQLRSCGILEDRRQGQWVYYRVHPQLPAWVRELLNGVLDANRPWLEADMQRLEGMRNRPERATICS